MYKLPKSKPQLIYIYIYKIGIAFQIVMVVTYHKFHIYDIVDEFKTLEKKRSICEQHIYNYL
jgi:hypothetical protein